jgi:hypothetical protein
MSRPVSLEQLTDRTLRESLKFFEVAMERRLGYAELSILRDQLRDLLKKRRAQRRRNRKLGLTND